jgi:hypothetical protein
VCVECLIGKQSHGPGSEHTAGYPVYYLHAGAAVRSFASSL